MLTPGEVAVEITSDGVGWVTIRNPAKRNALSTAMLAALDDGLRRLDIDPTVKVIVVRGDGTSSFAAGADISEFDGQQRNSDVRQANDDTVAKLFTGLEALSTPLIAMIYGHCLGAGVAVALGADMRIAAAGASFAIPAARLGIGYPVSLTHSLIHTVGRAHASDILFSGRTLTADEALEFGLVNRVVEVSDLENQVQAIVTRIAGNAPLSVRAAKAAIRSFAHPERRQAADTLVKECAASTDAIEGQQAFMEKRRARFVGA